MTDDERPDADARHVVELEPDNMGVTKVQQNGLLYVGREFAGEEVRFVVERVE